LKFKGALLATWLEVVGSILGEVLAEFAIELLLETLDIYVPYFVTIVAAFVSISSIDDLL
jgi:hypothetical protein